MFLTGSSIIRGITAFTNRASARALHISQLSMAPIKVNYLRKKTFWNYITGFFQVFYFKVGDQLPAADLFEDSPANKVNICELTAGKKVVLFAVPGAFTPGCSKTHLPGYVQNADKLKSDGVAEIVCVSVNDPYVMAAWGAQHNTKGKVIPSYKYII